MRYVHGCHSVGRCGMVIMNGCLLPFISKNIIDLMKFICHPATFLLELIFGLQGYGSFLLRDVPFDAIQFCIYEQLRIGYRAAVS